MNIKNLKSVPVNFLSMKKKKMFEIERYGAFPVYYNLGAKPYDLNSTSSEDSIRASIFNFRVFNSAVLFKQNKINTKAVKPWKFDYSFIRWPITARRYKKFIKRRQLRVILDSKLTKLWKPYNEITNVNTYKVNLFKFRRNKVFLHSNEQNTWGWLVNKPSSSFLSGVYSVKTFQFKRKKLTIYLPCALMHSHRYWRHYFFSKNATNNYKISLVNHNVRLFSYYSDNFHQFNIINNSMNWERLAAIQNRKIKKASPPKGFKKYKYATFKARPILYRPKLQIYNFVSQLMVYINLIIRKTLTISRQTKQTWSWYTAYIKNIFLIFTTPVNWMIMFNQIRLSLKSTLNKNDVFFIRSISKIFDNSNKNINNYKTKVQKRVEINPNNCKILNSLNRKTFKHSWFYSFFNIVKFQSIISFQNSKNRSIYKFNFFKTYLFDGTAHKWRSTIMDEGSDLANLVHVWTKTSETLIDNLFFITRCYLNSISDNIISIKYKSDIKFISRTFNKLIGRAYRNSRSLFISWFYRLKFRFTRYQFNMLVVRKGKAHNLKFAENSENETQIAKRVELIDEQINNKQLKKLFKKPEQFRAILSNNPFKLKVKWKWFPIFDYLMPDLWAGSHLNRQHDFRRSRAYIVFKPLVKVKKSGGQVTNKYNKVRKFRFRHKFSPQNFIVFVKRVVWEQHYINGNLLSLNKMISSKNNCYVMIGNKWVANINYDISAAYKRRKFIRLNKLHRRKFVFSEATLAKFLPSYKEINFRTNSVLILSHILNDQVWVKPDIKNQFKLILSGLYREY